MMIEKLKPLFDLDGTLIREERGSKRLFDFLKADAILNLTKHDLTPLGELVRDSGKEFDIVQSVNAQIPFFACRNILYTKEAQEDIQRYLYCKEFGVSPYEGDYSKHPAKWIDKAFIIKKAIAKQERKLRDVRKDSNKI